MAKKRRKIEKKQKKSRVDFLREKFVDMPISYIGRREDSEEVAISEDSFEQILEADPSKNKQYISWLLDIYSKGRLKLEDLYKAKEYLTYVYKYKHKLQDEAEIEFETKDGDGKTIKEKKKINPKNVSDYWDLNQLYTQIAHLTEMDEEELMSESSVIKSKKEKDVEVVFEDEDWKIVIPLSQDMANLYGQGTKWCTTSRHSNGQGMFAHYTIRNYPGSKLYIIINKKAPADERVFHKYQFHYESNQFMDATDGRVNLDVFFKSYPKVLDVLSRLKYSFGFYLRLMYDINWGKEGKVIDGDIDFSRFNLKTKSFPDDLIVKGRAVFTHSKVRIIKNLTVTGDLVLVSSDIEKIDGSLKVGGSVFAKGSSLRHLPDNTEIG